MNANLRVAKKDRFFIGKSKWNMSHEQYVDFLKRLKELYKKIMKHKNELIQTEKWKSQKDYFYITIQDEDFIQLKKRKQHIYRKLGKIIYKKYKGEIPSGIGISILKEHPQVNMPKKKFNKNVKNKKNVNKNGIRKYNGNRK